MTSSSDFPALDALGVQIVDAARRRERRFRPAHPLRVAVAVAALAAGGTALAATTPWSPQVGDEHRGHPAIARGPVPAEQSATLGVLRREQTEADRGPRAQAVLKGLPAGLFEGVKVDEARLLASWADGAAVLVPVAEVRMGPAGRAPTRDALCMMTSSDYMTVGRNGTFEQVYAPSSGGTCGTLDDIRARGLLGGAEIRGRLVLTGIVPDGVARIELTLRDGRVVGAPVHDNAFHLDEQVTHGTYEDAPIRWLDADGKVLPKG